eukprot:scaffold2688_cov134-Skeletonema_menzelii.AAC.1
MLGRVHGRSKWATHLPNMPREYAECIAHLFGKSNFTKYRAYSNNNFSNQQSLGYSKSSVGRLID